MVYFQAQPLQYDTNIWMLCMVSHKYQTSSLSSGSLMADETIRKANNMCKNSLQWLAGAKYNEGCQLYKS